MGASTAERKPDFERLRTALLCAGEPDRVPLTEAMVDMGIKEAILGQPIRSLRDDVEFWRVAGYDFVPVLAGMRLFLSLGYDPLYDAGKRGPLVDSLRLRGRARYGVGDTAERERGWAQEHSGVIATWEDFERFPWPSPDQFDRVDTIKEVGTLLPGGMKVVVNHGYIFTPAWQLMGFETFCYALKENPALIDAMLERLGSIALEIFHRFVDMPEVGAVWISDDVAYTEGLMLAPQHFRRWLFPWYKRMGEVCRSLGKPFMYHSDGRLFEVMDDIIGCGFSALHPIEPKAMDIRQMKRQYGGRLCLMGNLDLGYTLTLGTPEEVVQETLGLLRDVAPGGGYCVGSSNSVPEYVPIANYRAMIETVLQYGRYPINIEG